MKGNPPHVLRPVSFDSIVIDEAAQASEPDIVLPATSASCRVIVVGDHKQLGLVEDISGYFRIFQDISGYFRIYQDGQVRLDTSRVFGLFKSRCSIKKYTV